VNKSNFSNLNNEIDNQNNISRKLHFEESKNSVGDDSKDNIDYNAIYNSINKTKSYLNIIDITRVFLMIALSVIIYFEFHLDNIFKFKKEKGLIITYIIFEISYTFICYIVKKKKRVNNFF